MIILAIAAYLGRREQFALKFKKLGAIQDLFSHNQQSPVQTEFAQLDLGAKDFGIIFCGLGLNQLPWGN